MPAPGYVGADAPQLIGRCRSPELATSRAMFGRFGLRAGRLEQAVDDLPRPCAVIVCQCGERFRGPCVAHTGGEPAALAGLFEEGECFV